MKVAFIPAAETWGFLLSQLYKKRIVEDNSKKQNHDVICSCGNVIGRDRSTRIKIDQTSIEID